MAFNPFKKMGLEREGRKIFTWVDRLSFMKILLLWAFVIALFGGAYFFFSSDTSYLFNSVNYEKVNTIQDTLYFSFITATTTGFGDIVPLGYFRLIATAEVVFGLLLLALVTSKLVSIKQNVIIGEIYDISFGERINRIRSSLLAFRQNISRIRARIDDKSITSSEIKDLYINFSSLEDVLNEVLSLTSKNRVSYFIKGITSVHAELILNSLILSFQKIDSLLLDLKNSKKEWKSELTDKHLHACLQKLDEFFNSVESKAILPDKEVSDFIVQKNEVVDNIRKKS